MEVGDGCVWDIEAYVFIRNYIWVVASAHHISLKLISKLCCLMLKFVLFNLLLQFLKFYFLNFVLFLKRLLLDVRAMKTWKIIHICMYMAGAVKMFSLCMQSTYLRTKVMFMIIIIFTVRPFWFFHFVFQLFNALGRCLDKLWAGWEGKELSGGD